MDLNIETIDQSGSWLKYIRGCTKKKVYWLYIVYPNISILTIAVYLPVEYRFMWRRSFQIEKYVLCIYKCLLFNIPTNNKQLLDEVEHDIMNYQNRGLYYLPQPSALADNTDLAFDNSWYHAKTEFNNCFIIHFLNSR